MTSPSTNTAPDLSIIIISHGHEEMIRQCVESLKPALHGINAEFVLVDNLNNGKLAAEVSSVSHPLKVINNTISVGFSANVNQAVAQSAGKYVVLLNPDTYLQSGRFCDALDYLESNQNVGILGCRIVYPDGRFQRNFRRWPTLPVALGRGLYINHWPWTPRFYRHRVMDGCEFSSPTPVDWITGAFLLFSRANFDKVGQMDDAFYLYYEDVDLCHRFKSHGLLTVYFPGIQIVHSLQRSSAARPLGQTWRWHGQSMWHYFTKHRYAFRPPLDKHA